MLLAAAKRAERCPGVCAIDLNLGCPQRSAHSGHFGAFLCAEQTDRLLVLRIVATLARQLTVPVFCKIRLLDEGVEETVAFAKQMEAAGCALLAVHGRYRGSPMHRRDGPAHLDQVRAIKQALSIPVLTNGNVRSAQELIDSLVLTGCDGVMSAEAALDDPAIFARAAAACAEERRALERQIEESAALKAIKRSKERKLTKEELHVLAERKTAKSRLKELPHLIAPATSASTQQPSCAPLDLADQYLELVRTHPPTGEKGEVSTEITMTHTIFHLRRLCRTLLTQYELLPILASATSIDAAAGVMQRCRDYADGVLNFTPGGEAARVEAEARAARKAANAARRAEYVDRMTAKARQEGHADDHYLRLGRDAPSDEEIRRIRAMATEKERQKYWRANYGQRCSGWYLSAQCPHLADERGCGFLHGDDEEM